MDTVAPASTTTTDPAVPSPGPRPPAATSEAFARTLAAAIEAPVTGPTHPAPPRRGRVTLGQMLGALGAGSRPVALGGPGGAPEPAPPAAGSRVRATPAADGLGVGPVARPLDHEVGSGFGPRVHPIHGVIKDHAGVDIGAPSGTPIAAFAAGEVVFAGRRGGYGNLVIVDHGNGVTTRYAHASSLDVAPGDRVVAGQRVARVGSTGLSTAPHLHFEVRRDGVPVDPAPYLP